MWFTDYENSWAQKLSCIMNQYYHLEISCENLIFLLQNENLLKTSCYLLWNPPLEKLGEKQESTWR